MWDSKNPEPVRVRPHHGMCLAYFKGSGYSGEFTAHMQEMLELFEQDIPVRLTVSTDEICSACPNNTNGICADRKQVEEYDNAVLKMCGVQKDMVLRFREFAGIIQDRIIFPGHRSEICGGCQWDDICRKKRSRWG